jgi:sarcosine oxidase subunit beta
VDGVTVDLNLYHLLVGLFAHTIAQDRVHELNSGFSLSRFSKGYLLDEKGLGTKTWIS